jgi:hypothetical protein
MNASEEKQAVSQLTALVDSLYRTNEGPRLIAEVMANYPNPRRLRGTDDQLTLELATKVTPVH